MFSLSRKRPQKATSMAVGICTCGCGRPAIVMFDKDNKIICTGTLGKEQMLAFAQETIQLVRPN